MMSETRHMFNPTISEKQFALLVGISVANVRRRRYAGELSHIRIGRRVLYRYSDVEQFLERNIRHAGQI
jgi:excisionase family DNA binding protein